MKGLVLMEFLLRFSDVSSLSQMLTLDGPLAETLGQVAKWQLIVLALIWVAFVLPAFVYIMTHPAARRRRFHIGPLAETDPTQKLIIFLLILCFVALAVFLALDTRFGWSNVPIYLVPIGDLLIVMGQILLWLSNRANPFVAATVQVKPEQVVISTGPYAYIRHPLYSGILLVFLGFPLALGGWLGFVPYLLILFLIIWRLREEERYLSIHLPGYRDYCARVTHQLIPFVW